MTRFLTALGRIGIYFIPFLIGLLVVLLWFRSNFIAPVSPGDTSPVLFEVVKGSNIKSIAKELESRSLVKHWYSVVYLSKFRSKDDDSLKILAGEYELSAGMRPVQILDILLSGKIVMHEVTVTPGTRISELPIVLAKSGLVTPDDVKRAIADRNLIADLGIPAVTLEGFVYPETYSFSRPVTASEMIRRMVSQWKTDVDDKIPGWKKRAAELNLSVTQVMTLASVIEKETGLASERPTISSVFHNRLRIGMPLQSDPTVIYGIRDFNGNLTKEDLKTPSDYNTYINTGLPPTPICSPGLESIRAALYPEDTDFLYFVARGDGSHQFSAMYKDHLAAVNQYQKGQGASSKPK